MNKEVDCQHTNRMDDKYGVTCQECGVVLEGYGYGGWLGRDLNEKEHCVHAAWYVVREGKETCPYCYEALSVID